MVLVRGGRVKDLPVCATRSSAGRWTQGVSEPQAGPAATARRRRKLMPRRARSQASAGQRPVYRSQLVTQLVNKVLLDGKKSLAERIVYGALEQAREKTGTDPVVTRSGPWTTSSPALEVR